MNVYYAKSVLCAYPHIEAVIEQIDELVERKALVSMNDFSPCEEIAEKILDLTAQKDAYIALKIIVDKTLKKLRKDELDCLDYKYFKQKPKEYYAGFDASCRGYFRKQIRIAKKFAKLLEDAGATDGWFEKRYMSMDFFKEIYKRVLEHEKKFYKNKPKKSSVVKTEYVTDRIKKELSA